MLRRGSAGTTSRASSLVTMVLGVLAALITTIVFLVDVSLVAIVRHKIDSGDLTLNWGNAVCVFECWVRDRSTEIWHRSGWHWVQQLHFGYPLEAHAVVSSQVEDTGSWHDFPVRYFLTARL